MSVFAFLLALILGIALGALVLILFAAFFLPHTWFEDRLPFDEWVP